MHGEMRWWGWGDPDHPRVLPDHAVAFLGDEVGLAPEARPPVPLDQVRVSDPALPDGARDRLAAVVGPEHVRDDLEARVVHAAGKSYPDLVRQRAGDCEHAPDAVVYPADHEQVVAVLAACTEAQVAVVPFGGGTSVVGGVEPLRGEFPAVVTLDLRRLDRVTGVDRRSLTATLEPGLRGPAAEAQLNAQGLTLGHFPQSYEYATIGGYVATRSAGQASTGYGRIDELVLGLRCAAPAGELDFPPHPASAAGPDLRELIVGSEGTLGVITLADFNVRPAPASKRYEGWFFRDFAEGVEAFRALEQEDAAPDVARLSDEQETRLSLALAGRDGLKARAGAAYLRLRGYEGGCLAILGWEGTEDDVARRCAQTEAMARRSGGLPLGRSPGESWARRAVRRALPARRPPLPGRHGRDAGDGDVVDEAAGPPRRRGRRPARGSGRPGHAAAGHVPRLPSLSLGRLAVLHVSRPPGGGGRAGPVGGGQARRRGRHRRAGRDDHPSPRDRPRPPAVDGGRGRSARPGRAARGQAGAGPGRDHEPGKAAGRER